MVAMPLEPGERVPEDLTVVDASGSATPLAARRGEAVLLVFLRHLA